MPRRLRECRTGLPPPTAVTSGTPAVQRLDTTLTGSHRTYVLAAGWMPGGDGFAITARRYGWRFHSDVALSVSIVGRAKTRAAIERETAAGHYGSTQWDIDRPAARFLPVGVVDCSAHPAVLLLGWAAPGVRAGLRQGEITRPLRRAVVPARLGLAPGVLVYGWQTSTASIIDPGGAAEPLGAPPRHRECRNGTMSIGYAFAVAGKRQSMRGSG